MQLPVLKIVKKCKKKFAFKHYLNICKTTAKVADKTAE